MCKSLTTALKPGLYAKKLDNRQSEKVGQKRIVMDPWHKKYITQYLANPGQNDAKAYGVQIVYSAAPQWGERYYAVIGVHHLTGKENGGQHNVFCEVLDENGQRLKDAVLIVSNVNNTVSHVKADKSENEPAANFPMFSKDTLTVSVAGTVASEKVSGLHTRHADEESGNTLGHHSFLIVFQLKRVGTGPTNPPVEPPEEEEPPIEEPTPVEDWRKRFTAGRLAVIEECRHYPGGLLTGIIAEMAELLDGK